MALSIGIVGLPNAGKSTLFQALTRKQDVLIANYPFATIEPNTGIVPVPDPRLAKLAEVSHSAKVVPTTVTFVDIAGLVKGAAEGEGLGNKFLAHIREADAIVQVVRVFRDPHIIHVHGVVDPKSDIEVINIELALADEAAVKRRLDALVAKSRAANDPKIRQEIDLYARVHEALGRGSAVRDMGLTGEEFSALRELQLLTAKPMLVVANSDEGGESEIDGASESVKIIAINAKLEAELAELSEEEAREYLQTLGEEESGLDRLIRASYELLDLITFFTSGEKETRAWTVKRGTKAPQAAGVIHTDFERGFIRVEVGNWEDFVREGGEQGMKAKGLWRLEGKEYVIQDGDVCYFRFAV